MLEAFRYDDPRSRLAKGLIVWYGLYQTGHFIFNGSYLIKQGDIPFASPPDGWSAQLIGFFNAMAMADLINAALSLGFVYGYFRRKQWWFWLGTLTLTVSIYAAVIFTVGTISAGAWRNHVYEYLVFYIPFIPVIVLFILLPFWVGRLCDEDRA